MVGGVSSPPTIGRMTRPSHNRRACVVVAAWAAFALALVAGAPEVRAIDGGVAVGDSRFEPGIVTVTEGETVTWTITGDLVHTVTADDGSFDSGPILKGQTFAHQFKVRGRVGYHCQLYPMTGSVVVEAARGPASTPTPTPAAAAPIPSESPAPAPGAVVDSGTGLPLLGIVALAALVLLVLVALLFVLPARPGWKDSGPS
jgi:plastocyanin